MRSELASVFIALLVAFAFGGVINSEQDTSNSVRPLEPRLPNESITPVESPISPSAAEHDVNPALGGLFDPNVWAGQTLWETYVQKGHQLLCLMQASDEGAGWLMQDTRQPPSAASRWNYRPLFVPHLPRKPGLP